MLNPSSVVKFEKKVIKDIEKIRNMKYQAIIKYNCIWRGKEVSKFTKTFFIFLASNIPCMRFEKVKL